MLRSIKGQVDHLGQPVSKYLGRLGCLIAAVALSPVGGVGADEVEAAAATAWRPALVRIPAGVFQMGSPPGEAGRYEDETRHQVTISRAFLLSATEVTQRQYQAVVGNNPSYFKGPANLPVEQVRWFDGARYCNLLSKKEGLTSCYQISGESVTWPQGLACGGYRLPTEAEWERASRARDGKKYAGGNDPDLVAWYRGNSGGKPHRVAKKKANGWGLYDMSGNVWEWVWDLYAEYPSSSVTDPIGPGGGSDRVLRGGSFWYAPPYLRPAFRDGNAPGLRFQVIGLRVARSSPSPR